MVRKGNTVELSESGGVEWVLGDRDQDASLVWGDENVEEKRDACGCTGSEEDILWIARVSITI